ncbi:hypothetical protein OQA88_5492 [Cercophora sp. LCS_1]
MSFSASSSFDGTVQEYPLRETNGKRDPRTVIVKCRKLGGKRGKLIRAIHKIPKLAALFDDDLSYDDYSEVSSGIDMSISHWGVQVGDYLWELHTDNKHAKTLTMQRLTGPQIWFADVGTMELGETNLTDKAIDQAAKDAFSDMKCRSGGKYDEFENNCQHFVEFHLRRLLDDETVDGFMALDPFRP